MMPMIVEMCPCSALICSLNAQVNVELLTIDKRTFTTDEGLSLQTLFGENSEGSAQYRAEVSTIASRLATVFASLKVCLYSCHASNTARICREGTCQISQPAMRGIIVLHRQFKDSQTCSSGRLQLQNCSRHTCIVFHHVCLSLGGQPHKVT